MSAGTAFTTIRTEGAILPPDILNRIAAGDKDLGGLTESAYHPGEKFGEATNRAWNRLQSARLNFQTARENLAAGDAGTTIARERWLLPLFQLLDYGRLQIAKGTCQPRHQDTKTAKTLPRLRTDGTGTTGQDKPAGVRLGVAAGDSENWNSPHIDEPVKNRKSKAAWRSSCADRRPRRRHATERRSGSTLAKAW
jgi:hypothetical protein